MQFARRQFLTPGAGEIAAAAGASTFGGLGHAAGKLAKRPIQTTQELIQPAFQPATGPVDATSAAQVSAALPTAQIRRAAIHNLHTGEMLDAVYWENGAYVPDALA